MVLGNPKGIVDHRLRTTDLSADETQNLMIILKHVVYIFQNTWKHHCQIWEYVAISAPFNPGGVAAFCCQLHFPEAQL